MNKECEATNENMFSVLDFQIIRPGGNDTALVEGIVEDEKGRKAINDEIMGNFPNVEQVGFWERDLENVRLMMAGGEFCGNATRSTAWLALGGKEGNTQIEVLGIGVTLDAGVNSKGEAWAQMPIYSEKERVKFLENGLAIVEMQGITQVVCNGPERDMSIEEYKESAKKILSDLDLLKTEPASGVMFLQRDQDKIRINPVVWVRDIETYFYETACGSGTTAVGMVEALKANSSVECGIVQPTGQVINIAVGFDGEKFTRAEISGQVENFGKERIEI